MGGVSPGFGQQPRDVGLEHLVVDIIMQESSCLAHCCQVACPTAGLIRELP